MGNVVVNGRLVPTEEADNYRLEALRRNISFDGIRNGSVHFSVIFKDTTGARFFAGAIDLRSGKRKLSDKVLCVDFGTSNTTCGIYDDDGEIRIVRFEDVTSPEHKSSYLCPTLVYVSKIARKDPETDEALEVEYLFGYDAKQKLLENDYNPKGSIFFEIKRWITSPDQEEDITDGDTEAHIKRKEIISAYLHYIIKMAESDLKCRFYRMHFAAPVKLKSRFIQFLQDEVFITPVCEKRYEIMSASDSIDEGVAIIYNQISEMISRSGNVGSDPAASGKIIIVDCGGGTTDLASCTYSYNKKSTGYDLNLETRFENGNSNFGGNNITYRIFQLLKIRLAARLNNDPEPYTVKSLIEMDDTDALNVVDRCIADATRLTIYDKIDRLSCETEQILPTDFNGSSVYAQKITTKMETKRNFYFLWQLAEKVKVALFTGNDVRCVVLNPVRGMEYPDSKVLYDPLSFFIRNPYEKLPPLKQCSVAAGDPLIITAQEVISLIQPDIYYLLAGMFDGENASLLNQCDYIKLAGQSCKIGLFRSLLKEFVPGRKLRSGETIEPIGDDSDKYKLDCVCGCIIYIRDKVFHFINSFNKQTNQNIIYDVELSRGGMERKVLFRGNAISSPEHAGDFAQFLHVEPYKPKPGNFSLRIYHNGGGRTLENEITIPIGCERYAANLICSVQSNRDDLKTMHAKLIGRCYPTLVRETGDDAITALISKLQSADLEDGESRVFVCAIPNSDGYSFTLYQILKCFDNGRIDYYFADTRSMNFENGVSFRSFFSGTNCEHDARLH